METSMVFSTNWYQLINVKLKDCLFKMMKGKKLDLNLFEMSQVEILSGGIKFIASYTLVDWWKQYDSIILLNMR